MGKTAIEWTDAVWNPVTGCSKVSEGCRNCYAEGVANRFWEKQYPPVTVAGQATSASPIRFERPREFTDVQVHPDRLEQPLHWKKPRRIFVNSMSDLFHEDVPTEFIREVFWTMQRSRWHTYQILTKRPERAKQFLSADPITPVLPNVWLGVSVEDQKTANDRIPILLQTPAAVRWISAEPLLGKIDLASAINQMCRHEVGYMEGDTGAWICRKCEEEEGEIELDWVIVGGESGPGARPMHPEWARSIRDQCQAAGVPFFFKQWGEWAPFVDNGPLPKNCNYIGMTGEVRVGDAMRDTDECMGRVGKKEAGRLLDGREWNEYPTTGGPE